jgi:hypothetical protein
MISKKNLDSPLPSHGFSDNRCVALDPVVRSILELTLREKSIQPVALVGHLESEWSFEVHCLIE